MQLYYSIVCGAISGLRYACTAQCCAHVHNNELSTLFTLFLVMLFACDCAAIVVQLWRGAVGDVYWALTVPWHVSQPGAAQRQHWQGASATWHCTTGFRTAGVCVLG